MNKVIIIKLVNNAEMLAELVEVLSDKLIINRPRVFQITTSTDSIGREVPSAGLIPWIISAPDQKNIELSLNSISAYFDAGKEISDGYMQGVSGLILG